MFHAMAEQKVRHMFASLSQGVYEPALESLAPDFEHVFGGDHALGGTRHSAAGLKAWFERLYRLFPDLDFEVGAIAVSGPPWDLTIVAEWIDRAVPAGGGRYENHGVHVIRLAWGKLASLHAYLDTKVLADCLSEMAASGIEEAAAPPITDPLGAPAHQSADPAQARTPQGQRPAAVSVVGASATGMTYLGSAAVAALALGAVAIGALAIGRLAVGRFTLGDGRIRRLVIDELVIGRRSGRALGREASRPWPSTDGHQGVVRPSDDGPAIGPPARS